MVLGHSLYHAVADMQDTARSPVSLISNNILSDSSIIMPRT